MEFNQLVDIVNDVPVFETGLLLAGNVDPNHIRRQLSFWVNAGRIYQLRRGLYMLAPPYQKIRPHPFAVANRLVPGSYVSCQSALAHYGFIPEYVPSVVSVCSSRPRQWDTALGTYHFRHVHTKYLFGYHQLDLGEKQQALIADPEKALLDLVYLTPGGDSSEYLLSLRLQNLEQLDESTLNKNAERFGKPKMKRAAEEMRQLVGDTMSEKGER
jgi:predicted transcriptional regulator of viral defense system